MVLKKTNICDVNSGNTMRKRPYREDFQKNISQTYYIVRTLKNVKGNDDKEELVDAASCYIEDGLSMTSTYSHTHMQSCILNFSLNKRKRWLLEESVAEAMKDKELAAEPFKVTFVRRAVPCKGDIKYISHNVERYYDSHISTYAITPNGWYSSQQDLIAKGKAWQDKEVKRRSRKKKLGHNQHFGGTQRKLTWGPFFEEEETDNADTVTPEVCYETAEPQQINSRSFSYGTRQVPYWTGSNFSRNGIHFRGFHRDRVSWYCMNSCWTKGTSELVLGTDDFEDEEDLETSADCKDYSVLAEQEFSLLDLAAATQCRQSRASKKNTSKVNNRKTVTSPVNSASPQPVHKHGKNSAIFFIQQEEEKEVGLASDELSSQAAEIETETDDHNRLEVESPLSAFDYAAEFTKFENSFCSCKVLQCEFSGRYLCNVLGPVVEIGNCIPFTAKFNVQAVSSLLENRTMDTGEHEWLLLCQVGEKVKEQFNSILHSHENVINVNLKLYSGHDSKIVTAANQKLHKLVKNAGQKAVFLSFTTLLLRVCRMLHGQLALHRLNTQAVQVLKSRDTYVPYEPYVSKVTVCNITQAFHHLKAVGKVSSPQVTEDPDLDSVCSLTWCDLECVICYDRFDEDDTVTERVLSPFVIISTCGHCFCRQCWQHHLVRKIMEGQTSVNCMEYKCGTALDVTTFMSMVPQWAFARWLHLVQSRAVESSGEWKWCPSAHCSLLATSKAVGKKKVNVSGKSVGVPVRCKCQKLWCLDCGKDGHWPVSCAQFDTYTKMLKQKGDEHGQGSGTEISNVQVKRCPGCNYPLEKRGGCSHMTCPQCPMHFCWECLVDWTEHVRKWVSCRIRAEETIELSNDKIYPLSIECYQKAVSFRFKRMQLRRVRHSSITAYHTIFDFLQDLKGKRAVVTLSEDAVSYVVGALQFVEKAFTLLELSYVLLSNATKSDYRLQKPLRMKLQQLEFSCERLMEHLQLPKKKVLLNAESLHRMSSNGQRLIHQICFRCHNITSQIHDARAQEWL